MKQILLTVLVVVPATFSTNALADTDWYAYDFPDNSCVTKFNGFPATPDFLINMLRQQGQYPTIQISRYPDGSIETAEVTAHDPATGKGPSGYFFTSEALCEAFRANLMENNEAADPNDLK